MALEEKKETKKIYVKKVVVEETYKPIFTIDLKQKIPQIPSVTDFTQLDVRYPLLEPYAYVHVYWDKNHDEVVYELEEPVLNENEKKVLKVLEDGIKELINISFIGVKQEEQIIEYLERNVRVLLNELDIKISDEILVKLMYYIYRDFVGLNEIEPLMHDYYIEDIECNGSQSPLYIVHRKYRNLRTNIIYPDNKVLASFVEKLAQKCGKYISYANPVLDGRLPDKSRVNATYTQEISTKGPTFTVRKFTQEPWTPIHLISFGTCSPELMAYLWTLIEYESNVMVIGGTGTGKTSLLNALAFFIPPQARIVSIEDSVAGDSRIIMKLKNEMKNIPIKEFYSKYKDSEAEVLTVDENGILKFIIPSSYIKHRVKKPIYEIATSTGRKIKVTEDHSLFTLSDNGLKEVKPKNLEEKKSFIAVPRKLPIDGNFILKINLMDNLSVFNKDYLTGEPLSKIFNTYKYKHFGVSKSTYQWWKEHKIIKINQLNKVNIKFSQEELKKLSIKSKNRSSLPVLLSLDKGLLEFFGLWLGDGCYDYKNKNVVIISNLDEECREIIKKIANRYNLNYSLMSDKGCSIRIHSTILYKFMRYFVGLTGYSKTKKIPDSLFNLSNDQLKHLLRGYFSADGSVAKYEISCSSQSSSLIEDIQTIFLRLGIISRASLRNKKDKCICLRISDSKNIDLFKSIGFLQKRKNFKLSKLTKKAHHASSDVIPLSLNKIYELNKLVRLQQNYLKGYFNIGRDFLQRIAPKGSEFNDLSHSDILWDKVKKIKKLKLKKVDVYDLSILGYEKFICNNIIVHNTSELNLVHENWLPSVARAGFGIAAITGERHGEVSLFTLLKESFRQRPDYVIVGEVRGEEANVLFQGAASGHPTMSTMHAEDVNTMIRRLETPPINLSPSLIESLDAVVIITQTKIKGKTVRRVREVSEVLGVGQGGISRLNTPFRWDPLQDNIKFVARSNVFNKIIAYHGLTNEKLNQEYRNKLLLLKKMYEQKIFDYASVQEIINQYYRNPEKALTRFGIL